MSSSPSITPALTIAVYRIDNYVPDFLFERFDALRDVLVEWLPMLGISGKTTKASSGAGDAPRELRDLIHTDN